MVGQRRLSKEIQKMKVTRKKLRQLILEATLGYIEESIETLNT